MDLVGFSHGFYDDDDQERMQFGHLLFGQMCVGVPNKPCQGVPERQPPKKQGFFDGDLYGPVR